MLLSYSVRVYIEISWTGQASALGLHPPEFSSRSSIMNHIFITGVANVEMVSHHYIDSQCFVFTLNRGSVFGDKANKAK